MMNEIVRDKSKNWVVMADDVDVLLGSCEDQWNSLAMEQLEKKTDAMT